jgi:lipoprotein-anchoring transpeptidase ErfK/SrfK
MLSANTVEAIVPVQHNRTAAMAGPAFALFSGVRPLLALAFSLSCSAAVAQEVPALVASEALAAQVMLDRAGFSPGEIDGTSGANVRRALRAFQHQHGLVPSGQLEPATWAMLVEVTGDPQPLVIYEIAQGDVAGPFTPRIPRDLMQQATLGALHYRTPHEALGERFHASPHLLRELNPDAAFSSAGERIVVPNVHVLEAQGQPESASPAGRAADRPAVTVIVSKATSSLTIADEGGTVLLHAPVTTGSEHDPLPAGTWKVTGIERHPPFHYNPDLFWDANPSHSKARIPPGPNNPVGVAWIDLSKEHYGIHGTPEPSRVGHAESHGCVRLTNWDVARALQWVRPGTPVVFR